MRTLLLLFVIAGCDEKSVGTPSPDLAVASLPDLSVPSGGDMTVPTSCNPVDPMTDGQACGNACPAGTIAVGAGADCHCWLKCDPSTPTECPCDRRCATLVKGDMGVVGGACLLANGPGERCGETGVTGKNADGCAQGLICINADDQGMFRYCSYDCTGNLPCPIQTACLSLSGVSTMACAYDSIMGGLAAGATCKPNDSCEIGYLCDGTCKPQCDRAGATCATGTCTALSDGTKTVGYVCK